MYRLQLALWKPVSAAASPAEQLGRLRESYNFAGAIKRFRRL